MMPDQEISAAPVQLGTRRAKKMLQSMVDCPFVLFVFDGDDVFAYLKAMDEESIELVSEALEQI